jgi:ABC-type cobalamin/Fe3+-siderophores transport system ATPase subunit
LEGALTKQDQKLNDLRQVITENLRIQRSDANEIAYINVGTALTDVLAKQNHTIFARRGCGKTLLLHHSAGLLSATTKTIYLNCEDFKRHSFPNVLIEILAALFRELERHLHGWFGKKKRSKQIMQQILTDLQGLQRTADVEDEDVRRVTASENQSSSGVSASVKAHDVGLKVGGNSADRRKEETERTFKIHKEKL